MSFEYKVVPAPTKGRRAKGARTAADRFALALQAAINELAEDGWEYLRTDTLPAEVRHGLAGKATVYQNMLVFRRATDATLAAEPARPETAEAAEIAAPKAPNGETGGEAEPTAAPANGNTLSTMIDREIAAARAPKLPAANDAQEVPTKAAGPTFSASRRNVAAE